MAQHSQQSLRIIGGQWRSRKLGFPDTDGLRPTSSRIRETLFNWLAPYIEGSQCLDLFSGSGALGIEALSRGASRVEMVESNPQAAKAIEYSLKTLNSNISHIHCCSAENYLEKNQGACFDIIFLDPPYALYDANALFRLVNSHISILSTTFVFYEHNNTLATADLPDNWSLLKHKKAGQVNYYLLKITAGST